jgi:hypothetical protein
MFEFNLKKWFAIALALDIIVIAIAAAILMYLIQA